MTRAIDPDRPRPWPAWARPGRVRPAAGPGRPKEHASSALLDSGPSPKVSGRQAADVQVALGRSHEERGPARRGRGRLLAALKKDPKRADAEARLAILADRKGDAAGGRPALRPGPEARPEGPGDPLRPGLQPLPPPPLGRGRGGASARPWPPTRRTPGATTTSAWSWPRRGDKDGALSSSPGPAATPPTPGRTSAWSWRWRAARRGEGAVCPGAPRQARLGRAATEGLRVAVAALERPRALATAGPGGGRVNSSLMRAPRPRRPDDRGGCPPHPGSPGRAVPPGIGADLSSRA